MEIGLYAATIEQVKVIRGLTKNIHQGRYKKRGYTNIVTKEMSISLLNYHILICFTKHTRQV